MKVKNRDIFIYILIIAVQVLVMLYWGRVKTNYYEDDFYSMGYASSFTGKGDTARYITTSPDFSLNEWIINSTFKKYLIVSDEEKVFNASFFYVMQKFVTGRNYFGFLNIAESIAGYSFVSSRPGVLLNIIFFIIAEFSLVSLMKKLNFDKRMRYLSLAMFGFSCYVISAVEYIRFYMMIIMFMIMILNLLYRLWNSEQWKQIIYTEAGIMILSYFAYRNSELTIAYFGAVMGSSIIAFFLTKKWRQFVTCIAMCLCGVGYISVTKDYIEMLLHPGNYPTSNRVAEASIKISEASFDAIRNYLLWVKQLFETYYFGSYWIIYLLAGAFTICLIIVSEQTDSKYFHFDMNRIRPITIMAILFWIGMSIASHFLGQGYYICVSVLCFSMFLAAKEVFVHRINIKKIKVSSDTVFILILVSAMGIYTIFNALALNIRWRYYCYGFVSGAIIVWYVLDRLFKKSFLKKAEYPLYIILTVFVIINALIPFRSRNIEYMYEDDAGFIENVRNNQELDVVMFLGYRSDGSASSLAEIYDCINLMPEDAHIYCVDLGKYEYSLVDYPDEFMLWTHELRDLTVVLEELDQHGYDLWELGSDHCSKAYVCKLR